MREIPNAEANRSRAVDENGKRRWLERQGPTIPERLDRLEDKVDRLNAQLLDIRETLLELERRNAPR